MTMKTINTIAEPRSPELSLMAWLGAASQHRKAAEHAAKSAKGPAETVKWAKIETAIADLISAVKTKEENNV
jgi:hypothetical protein